MNNALREFLVYIVLPLMAIAAAIAGFSGKLKVLGGLVIAMVASAMFAFIPFSTVAALGARAATFMEQALSGSLG